MVRAVFPVTRDRASSIICGALSSAVSVRASAQVLGPKAGPASALPSWRQYVAYAAEWEPIPDDGLLRFDEGKPGSFNAPAP
jgi:hypothetical protein